MDSGHAENRSVAPRAMAWPMAHATARPVAQGAALLPAWIQARYVGSPAGRSKVKTSEVWETSEVLDRR